MRARVGRVRPDGGVTRRPSLTAVSAQRANLSSSGGGTFATTSRSLAEEYARPNAHTERNARGRVIEPTVHEVVPHHEEHGDFDYDIDPNSGPGGWQDAPTIHEALEHASYGDEGGHGAPLMFPGRLVSKRQFKVE